MGWMKALDSDERTEMAQTGIWRGSGAGPGFAGETQPQTESDEKLRPGCEA